jgi:hypothetical protein
MMIDVADHDPVNYAQMAVAAVLAATGASVLVGMDYFEKKKIPKDAKPLLRDIENKWWEYRDYQFDLPWWLVLFIGIIAEATFLKVFQYSGLLLLLFYVLAVIVAFRLTREKFHMTLLATAFLFFSCVLVAPFSAAALQQPDFLTSILGLSTPNSRSATELLFLYDQAALILSTAMLVTHTWRLGLLRKNQLDGRAIRELVSKIIQKWYDSEHIETIQDINQDVPLVVQSFSEGNSALTISLGWSAILRGLDVLIRKKENPYKKAEEAGINPELFKAGKKVRNDFAHGRYSPTLNDSLNTLRVLREVLEKLGSNPQSE